jgi:hypothetical protein
VVKWSEVDHFSEIRPKFRHRSTEGGKSMETAVAVEVVPLTVAGEIESLMRLFEQVAEEEGWQPEGQLRAERPTARYLALTVGGELAGGLQVVLPDTAGCLPYLAVWPETAVPGRTAHATVLAVRREHRGRPSLFWLLCSEAWRLCVMEGIDGLVIEATPDMLRRYRRVGWPLEVVGDLRTHWGEKCYLCRMDVCALAGTMLVRALRSPMYRDMVARAIRPAEGRCAPRPALP